MTQTVLPGWTVEMAEEAIDRYEVALDLYDKREQMRRLAIASEQLAGKLADSWSRLNSETADVMSYIYDAVMNHQERDERAYRAAKKTMESHRAAAYSFRAAAAAEMLDEGAISMQAGLFMRLDSRIKEIESATNQSARPDATATT